MYPSRKGKEVKGGRFHPCFWRKGGGGAPRPASSESARSAHLEVRKWDLPDHIQKPDASPENGGKKRRVGPAWFGFRTDLYFSRERGKLVQTFNCSNQGEN